MAESSKAQERDESYATMTVRKAALAVERGRKTGKLKRKQGQERQRHGRDHAPDQQTKYG